MIHDTLLSKRNRDNAYLVNKLRAELIAPPYGIPACNLAILAAVAIRHEVKRLRWNNTKESDFAKNLTAAFEADSKLTIKLFEFSPKQLAMLKLVGDYFLLVRDMTQSREEFAQQCCYQLRDFVKGQSEAVKHSRQLHDKTQRLVKFFEIVGKSQQEIAEFLIELLELGNKSAETIASEAPPLIKDLLDEFAKVEDAKRFEIEQSWKDFLTKIEPHKETLILQLTNERASPIAQMIAELLNRSETVEANLIVQKLLNKPFEQCNDMDIGKCQMCLENHVNYHPPQAPLLDNPTIISPPASHTSFISNSTTNTSNSLVDTLRRQIDSMPLSREQIRQALTQLLNDYRD